MIPRRVSGFNLPALLPEQGFNVARALVGTEGTCVVVLEARTTLVDNPAVRSLLVFGCDDIFAAADLVVPIAAFGPILTQIYGMTENIVATLLTRSFQGVSALGLQAPTRKEPRASSWFETA